MLMSPQNTNESIRSVDMQLLCDSLLGADGPPIHYQKMALPPHQTGGQAGGGIQPSQPEEDGSPCWGGQLNDDLCACVPGFSTGKAHFKNKFCPNCRKNLSVPASRVRALTPELKTVFQNYLRAGFWKTAAAAVGGGEVRIANNTITCDGPWLLVYRRDHPVPDLPWAPMPEEWVSDGVVKFSVAKGTLVPVAEMGQRPGKRPPPSYAMAADAPPKRQRRANKTANDIDVADLPITLQKASGSGAGADAPDAAPSVVVAGSPAQPIESRGSSTTTTRRSAVTARAQSRAKAQASQQAAPATPPYEPLAQATPALIAAAAAAQPLPVPPTVPKPPVIAAVASLRPTALVVQSPSLSRQGSMLSATTATSSPPTDPAQLAAQLVAAHEYIAGMLEQALKPLSPLRAQLRPDQAANLYEQLNKTRALLEDSVQLTRAPAPSPPARMASTPMSANEDEHAFDSLVQAANEATVV